MNPTVLTLGHSYIRRLSNYCKMNRMSTNFGITYINGIMYGKGGTKLCNMIQDHVFQRLISKFSPTIVVLQIGGNDIDNHNFKVNTFIETFKKFLRHLKSKNVKKVVIVQLFHRLKTRVSRSVYAGRRAQINLELVNLTKREFKDFLVYWTPKRLTSKFLLTTDGVHLNKTKMRTYYYSLKRAVKLSLRK